MKIIVLLLLLCPVTVFCAQDVNPLLSAVATYNKSHEAALDKFYADCTDWLLKTDLALIPEPKLSADPKQSEINAQALISHRNVAIGQLLGFKHHILTKTHTLRQLVGSPENLIDAIKLATKEH
jgi:hypothetical protein